MQRRDKLLSGLRVEALEGAEIGALASPFVTKADGPIIYIDHADTASLRRLYGADPNIDAEQIVEVDAIWGDNTIQQALGPDRSVDYVVASHVAEHVPDLVTWLQEIATVLRPGGTLRLIIPDMRFCFDYLREESRLSDVLTAYYLRSRRPQIREVLDSNIFHLHMDRAAAWGGEIDRRRLLGPEDLARAFSFADRATSGEYVDSHCWTFTLASLASIMRQLGSLGLTHFACREYFDTEIDDHEFFVILEPSDPEHVIESWTRVYEAVAGPDPRHRETWPEARVAWLRRWAVTAALEAEVGDLRARLAAAEEASEAVKASTSWRLTRPLRALGSLSKRG